MPNPDFLANIRRILEATFKTAWADHTPVRYPNVVWKQPAAPFAVFNIQWGASNQLTLGTTKREEQNGIVVITLTTATGIGSDAAYALADRAQRIFRYQQLTHGTTTVNIHECGVGAASEGATGFSLNVVCRFKAEDEF